MAFGLDNWDRWDYANWGNNRLIYTGGRILLGLVMASMAFTSLPLLGLVAVAATGLLQGFIIWRDQKQHEEKLLQDYRHEIAAKLNLNPAEVTVRDLHTIADGDPEMGLQGNSILKEAVNRNGTRQIVRLVSTIASALSVFAVFLMLPSETIQAISKAYGELLQAVSFKVLGKDSGIFWRPIGAMLASGIGMSMFNYIYDYFGEKAAGLDQRSASSYIREIRHDLSKGMEITYERVFGVFVAADTALSGAIAREFGAPYEQLSAINQAQALIKYGKHYPILEVTKDLNNHQIDANELAFVAVGQKSGVPRYESPRKHIPLEIRALQELGMNLSLTPELPPAMQRVNAAVVEVDGPANDNRTASFVDRVGGARRDTALSHVERLEKQRELAALRDKDTTR